MTPPPAKRGKAASVGAIYRAYHGYGLNSDARIAYTFIACTMMIVATIGSMAILILSSTALQGIYGWYPRFVAQQWFIYDQLLTAFSFLELMFGALATALIFSRKSSLGAVASATACTLSGASAFVVSLIQPLALLWQSLLYYFLPLFVALLTGTLLTYLQRQNHGTTKTEQSPN
jgi:hypothetical protein